MRWLISCGALLYNFWFVLGYTYIDPRFAFWLVELGGEAFISDLELSSVVHPMVYLEGTESVDLYLEGTESVDF